MSEPFAGPCLINSLPKSGTHLLAKTIWSLPGVSAFRVPFKDLKQRDFSISRDHEDRIPIGVGRPNSTPCTKLRSVLEQMKGRAGVVHFAFSPAMAGLLAELQGRMVLIIRDPRDVAVSHAHYVPRALRGPMADYYRSLSEIDRISTSILGCRGPGDDFQLLSIKERLERVLPWRSQSFTYMTTFERLIGPPGGGSREIQVREIHRIAEHLGKTCPDQQIALIAERSFGGTATFNKGRIGRWREFCNDAHKQALKQLVGQHLIDLGYEKDYQW